MISDTAARLLFLSQHLALWSASPEVASHERTQLPFNNGFLIMSDNWKGGYKTPPMASRFKPGRSGNPNGRPKQRPRGHQNDPLDIVMRTLTQPLSIQVNGLRRRGPAIELVARRLARKAASGNSRSAKLAWELIDLVYAWEKQNISSGQMEVFHMDQDGIRRPGRPTRPPQPENQSLHRKAIVST